MALGDVLVNVGLSQKKAVEKPLSTLVTVNVGWIFRLTGLSLIQIKLQNTYSVKMWYYTYRCVCIYIFCIHILLYTHFVIQFWYTYFVIMWKINLEYHSISLKIKGLLKNEVEAEDLKRTQLCDQCTIKNSNNFNQNSSIVRADKRTLYL